jgi:hypothetical protein
MAVQPKKPEDVKRTPAGGASGTKPLTDKVQEQRDHPEKLPEEGTVDRRLPQERRDPEPA